MSQPTEMPPQRYYEVMTALYRELFGDDWHLGYWLDARTLQEAAQRMNELLLRHLAVSERMTVLDLGCGVGGGACFLARSTGCRVVGVTNSHSGLAEAERLARERGLDRLVSFQFADALALPFADATFDAVWSCEAIHNVTEKAPLARELARVTKAGATLVVGDLFLLPQTGLPAVDVDRLKGFSFHLQTAEDWIRMLADAGVHVNESISIGHHVAPSLDVCTSLCRQKMTTAQGLERVILERTAEATSFLGETFGRGQVSWGVWVARKQAAAA